MAKASLARDVAAVARGETLSCLWEGVDRISTHNLPSTQEYTTVSVASGEAMILVLQVVDLCCPSVLLVAVPVVGGFLLVAACGLLLPEVVVVVVEVVLLSNVSLQHMWRNEAVKIGQLHSSISYVVWKFVRTRVIVSCFLHLLGVTTSILASVLCSQKMLQDIHDHPTNLKNVWVSPVVLVAMEAVSLFLVTWSWSIAYRTGIRARSASMFALYSKMIRISTRSNLSPHQMVTLISADCMKIYDVVVYGPLIFTTPFVFLVCLLSMVYLVRSKVEDMMPVASLVLSIFFIVLPLLCVLLRVGSSLQNTTTRMCSRRLAMTLEFLANITHIKMSNMEEVFLNNIIGTHTSELRYMRFVSQCEGMSWCLLRATPVVSATLLYYFQPITDKQVDWVTIFPMLLILFGYMRTALTRFRVAIKSISDADAPLQRLKSIFMLEEVDRYSDKPINSLQAICINNASFTWESNQPKDRLKKKKITKEKKDRKKATNRNEHVKIKNVELEIIMEPVLKDINFQAAKGKLIGVCGSPASGKTSLLLAILGQLQKASGQVMRDGLCAYVCQPPWIWNASLKENIVFKDTFDNKRFYNAVNSCLLNEDIVRLPGSEDTMLGDLNLSAGQKQRIALARACYSNSRCDEVYLLADGEIVAQGRHDDLLATVPCYTQAIVDFMQGNNKKYFMEDTTSLLKTTPLFARKGVTPAGSLASQSRESSIDELNYDEEEGHDRDDSGPLLLYLKFTGSLMWTFVCFLIHVITVACVAIIPLLFVLLPTSGFLFSSNADSGLNAVGCVCIVLLGIILVASVIWSLIFSKVTVNSCREVHTQWINKISRASMDFFQSLSTTDILKLCSLSLQEIEVLLPASLSQCIESTSWMVMCVIMVGYACKWTLAPLLLCTVFTLLLAMFCRMSSQKLWESEDESELVMLNHIVTTVVGRTSIQAFSKEKDFLHRICDDNATSLYLMKASSRWLGFWIQMCGVVCVGVVLAILVCLNVSPEELGLALLCLLQLGGCAQRSGRTVVEMQARLERLYNNNLKIQWKPGQVQTKGRRLVRAKTNKLGTGFGKFDLSLVGWECEAGKVCIGGTNIAGVPLGKLRSSISIVSQDPILLAGTLKLNIDPKGQYNDEDIWDCLQQVGLLEKVTKLPLQLNTKILGPEEGWTSGEKQLLGLARALLTNVKLLILEESLETLSPAVEERIHSSVKDYFSSSTVIIIAHRLQFVKNCDKVMAIHNGKVGTLRVKIRMQPHILFD
uniref:Uncharacterized protein n=1 Tax=Timema cristinae TaxID=61476 RepID=A0A7R9CRJ9_TIMCR|nr:unnamed protein product [Timema cristinae]